jgi:hypothetical protein
VGKKDLNQEVTAKEKTPRPYKIQRPLVHSGPFEYLVYSRGRETEYYLPGPDAAMDQLMAGRPKIYVLAHFGPNMKIIIHHVVNDQGF